MDRSTMTNEQLDEAVARRLGWKYETLSPDKEWPHGCTKVTDPQGRWVETVYRSPAGMVMAQSPADYMKPKQERASLPLRYSTDIAAAMGLVSAPDKFGLKKTESGKWYAGYGLFAELPRNGRGYIWGYSNDVDSPARAIVLAFLAAHDAEAGREGK